MNATLAQVEDAGTSVLTLTEGVEQDEFLRLRLTRAETRAQVLRMSDALNGIDGATREALPEIDWAGWHATGHRLRRALPRDAEQALWLAVQALVPATLMWLRFYRQRTPELLTSSG